MRYGKLLPVLITLLCVSSQTHAQLVPQWEAGAGFAYIDFPDYRGASERQRYLLPIPYVIYHGDILRVSRQRVRGLLFHSDSTELDISLNGSVPVRNNSARQGMPDLDPTFEVGPSLNVSMYRASSGQAEVELRLPVRAVIATNLSYFHNIGMIFQPMLNLDVHNAFGMPGWNLGTAVSPIFTDRRYNQYFYGIDAAYATPDRPAYSAHGGYAGSQYVIAMTKRFPGYWVSGFLKLDTLKGAAFADSALVRKQQFASGGVAITWIFAQSSTKVEEDD